MLISGTGINRWNFQISMVKTLSINGENDNGEEIKNDLETSKEIVFQQSFEK